MGLIALLCRVRVFFMLSVVFILLLKDIRTSSNGASSYSIKIKKYVCIDTPYKESTLHYCKSIPRRNAPTMISVSMDMPKLYNDIVVKVQLFYKFSTYQPFLVSMETQGCELVLHPPQFGIQKYVYDIIEESVPDILLPCPAGNRTFNITWYLKDKYAPRNIPAGDYKLQFKLIVQPSITLFGMDVYCAVHNNIYEKRPTPHGTTIPIDSSYSLKVTKYVCIDTPYKESTLHYCKSIPRRNAPTLISLSVHVPNRYNDIVVKVQLFYKFSTYQPFLITMETQGCEFVRHPPKFGIEKYVYDIMNESLPQLIVPTTLLDTFKKNTRLGTFQEVNINYNLNW
uniref:Uncharacterized protein n=1 Tax=Anopheles funestus TaxID=62324 RepID=A0A4Y0BP43_ANOFN